MRAFRIPNAYLEYACSSFSDIKVLWYPFVDANVTAALALKADGRTRLLIVFRDEIREFKKGEDEPKIDVKFMGKHVFNVVRSQRKAAVH